MSDDTLQRLYRGEIAEVHVTISTRSTEARECPDGVYRLTHADFVVVCDKLAAERQMVNGALCSQSLDYHGFGDRWFRLSEPVAVWIRSRPPVIQTFGHIG